MLRGKLHVLAGLAELGRNQTDAFQRFLGAGMTGFVILRVLVDLPPAFLPASGRVPHLPRRSIEGDRAQGEARLAGGDPDRPVTQHHPLVPDENRLEA